MDESGYSLGSSSMHYTRVFRYQRQSAQPMGACYLAFHPVHAFGSATLPSVQVSAQSAIGGQSLASVLLHFNQQGVKNFHLDYRTDQ